MSSVWAIDTLPGVSTFDTTDIVSVLKTDATTYKATGSDIILAVVKAAWPIGSVFINVTSTSPATLLGFGTWSAFGAGRVLVGQNGADTDFDVGEETGGAKTVTLTSAEMPIHTHVQNAHTHIQDVHTHVQNSFAPRIVNSGTAGTVGVQGASTASNANASNAATTATNQNTTATNQNATAVNQNAGSGGAHNNLQPYIVVYMWKRTA